jgi:D-3-phosphoglycerate dehydrogenase
MTAPRVFRIAVADGALRDLTTLRTEFAGTAELAIGPVETAEEVAALTDGADALLVGLQPLRQHHFQALASSVEIVARAGVGLDTIDVEAARTRGIRVVYQPNYATNEVADHACSMALASWRHLISADALVRQGWGTSTEVGPVHALQDATLGVLGSGRIGRSVAARLKPFVRRIVAFDAYPDRSLLPDVEWAETFDDLTETANLLTLHLPLTDETHHVINAEAIARMPDGAVLVNVSRGGLVDEHALADALRIGKLSAAALDVFEAEPLAADSPLRGAPNLLFSPHVAWYSIESGHRLAWWSIEDVISFLQKSDLRHGAWAWR